MAMPLITSKCQVWWVHAWYIFASRNWQK